MSKRMSSKLAKSLRQARAQRPAMKPKTVKAKKTSSPARRAPAAAARSQRFARQSDQSPPLSLDRPWANLHPERIWPD